jgi:hypothetical protein
MSDTTVERPDVEAIRAEMRVLGGGLVREHYRYVPALCDYIELLEQQVMRADGASGDAAVGAGLSSEC